MAKKSGNPNDFLLPDLGEGLDEAELIEWCVKEGQTVEEHDILAKMETAKALVEVPSPRDGTISLLHGKPGDRIKVGMPLVSYGSGAAQREPAAEKAAAAPMAKPQATAGPRIPHGAQAAFEHHSKEQAENPSAVSTDPAESFEPAESSPSSDAGTVVGKFIAGVNHMAAPGQVLAPPSVRRLARELGIGLEHVTGSGIGGRITVQDVRAAAGEHAQYGNDSVAATALPASRKAPPAGNMPAGLATPPGPGGDGQTIRTAIRGVRRTIAERMRHSISNAVHYTVMDEADATALDLLRKKLGGASNEKLSFLPFISSAVCRLLSGRCGEEFRKLNSRVDDEKQEVVQYRAVHLGIAADTENGLMVPVIKDADRLGVLELSRQISQLAQMARNRTASPGELMGSTFTISNFGSLAGRFATPIINYPEVGILGAGRVREAVVVRNGMMGVGKVLPLSLVADHRVIDGATVVQALAKLIELLQNPEELLAPAR